VALLDILYIVPLRKYQFDKSNKIFYDDHQISVQYVFERSVLVTCMSIPLMVDLAVLYVNANKSPLFLHSLVALALIKFSDRFFYVSGHPS
jgi:hypothetical protein